MKDMLKKRKEQARIINEEFTKSVMKRYYEEIDNHKQFFGDLAVMALILKCREEGKL